MRIRFGRIEVSTVKPAVDKDNDKEGTEPRITFGHIAVACEKAIEIYAAKKTIDFIFGAATHLVVTKIK